MEAYLLRVPISLANILAILQPLKHLGNGRLILPQFLHLQGLPATFCLLLQILQSLFNEFDILQAQLLADDIEISHRVNVTLNVNDLCIIEAPHDLKDRVDSADVRQECISQSGTRRGPAGQTGNVVDGQVGGDSRCGLVVFAQPVIALVRNNDARLFRVNGRVGEVGGVTQRRLGDGLEQGRFADIGEADLSRN